MQRSRMTGESHDCTEGILLAFDASCSRACASAFSLRARARRNQVSVGHWPLRVEVVLGALLLGVSFIYNLLISELGRFWEVWQTGLLNFVL